MTGNDRSWGHCALESVGTSKSLLCEGWILKREVYYKREYVVLLEAKEDED